jgi:hypothetical protein
LHPDSATALIDFIFSHGLVGLGGQANWRFGRLIGFIIFFS